MCVFTSGQGAAEKERGSAGQVVEDFTEHLPAEKTTGGGRRSSLPLPAASTGAASYLLVPGAPRGVPPAVVVRVKLGCKTSTAMEM